MTESSRFEKLREHFPILRQTVHGKPLVYLDSAATSQKPLSVILAQESFYAGDNANVHRGIHTLSERATAVYEGTRSALARFIGAARSEEIVWTKNATEALNLVALGYAKRHFKAGDEILISLLEHHSNIVPWQLLERTRGIKVRWIRLTDDGRLDLEHLEKLLESQDVKLVSIAHVSNVLGTINPIARIAERVHAAGALLCVDGCQAIPHLPVNVQALDADFYAFSSHKMLGPTGLGALYGRSELLNSMDPVMGGGEMIEEVTTEGSTFKEAPWRFEAGTPPIAEVAGLAAALKFLTGEAGGMDKIAAHTRELTNYALERIDSLQNIRVFGPLDPELRAGLISFEHPVIHAHDMAQFLDAEGVAVRAGHHCAQPVHQWMNSASTCRASFQLYNTRDEVDVLIDAIKKASRIFGGKYVAAS